jgi:hypothetical protein
MLNITDRILDKLGFSEYWDEHGTWGGRTLIFDNGTRFRIVEQSEMDDMYEGYAAMSHNEPIYVSNHFYFAGWFANPRKMDTTHYDLFFLHQLYECIEKEYPDCLGEFTAKCKELNMYPYIRDYLAEREETSK